MKHLPGLCRTSVLPLVAGLFALAACTSGGAGIVAPSTEPSADPTKDKLAQVLARGTLVLSTDLEYPPQSFDVEGATRPADTRCTPDQLTGPEVAGYDVDTGKAVAAALGVEPCFVTPSWTQITAGNWADRWDVAWGSGAINADRMTRLYMTKPYYSDVQRFYVHRDSPYQVPSDLDGAEVGACASCTHELYLRGELEVPGVEIEQKVADPIVVTFQAERPGLDAVAAGEIDAFLLATPVGEQAIAEGLPLRAIEEAAFPLYSTGFLDRSSRYEQAAFLDRVNGIVEQLHADGTLSALSMDYFGVDLATAAAEFDLDSIGQVVP